MKHPLEAFREERELSQQGLADLLGCSQSLVAHIEAGNREVTKDNAEKWEEVTGIPRLSLLYPKDYPYPAAAKRSTGARA
jgi:transcriptional regulator with XRE-family HTH domain